MKIKADLKDLCTVAKHFEPNGIYLLQGDLASGKTTLVNAICLHLLDQNASSPTFSVMNTYTDGAHTIYHYDIYQNGCTAFVQNGLFENLFSEGLHLIEWGDDELIALLDKLQLAYKIIKITPQDKGRLYEFS